MRYLLGWVSGMVFTIIMLLLITKIASSINGLSIGGQIDKWIQALKEMIQNMEK